MRGSREMSLIVELTEQISLISSVCGPRPSAARMTARERLASDPVAAASSPIM